MKKDKAKEKIEWISASQALKIAIDALGATDIPKRQFLKRFILSALHGAITATSPYLMGHAINSGASSQGLSNPQLPLFYGASKISDFITDQINIANSANAEDMSGIIWDNCVKNASQMYLYEDTAFRLYTPLPSFQDAASRAANAVQNMLFNGSNLLYSVSASVTAGALLFSIDKRIFAALAAWGAANIAWMIWEKKKVTAAYEEISDRKRDSNNRALDIAKNVSIVQRTGNEDTYKNVIDKEFSENRTLRKKAMDFSYLNSRLRTGLDAAVNLSTIYAMFLIAQKTGLQIGSLTAMTDISERFMFTSSRVSNNMTKLYQNIIQYNQAQKILSHRPTIKDKPNAIDLNIAKLKRNPPLIEFKNVSFHYEDKEGNPQQDILQNFSLTLRGGEQVAIMGDSGSGKTTFLSLLLREFEPQSGEIWIDGHKNDDVTIKSLRTAVRYIPQKDSFLNCSVRENLLLVRPDASEKQINMALSQANMLDIILEKGGLDTEMGSSGDAFSGGQKHRIGIARAFLAHAPVMVFDEPTSDLDPKIAKHIMNAIKTAVKGKTAIIVTHNPVVAQEFNRVIVMRHGKIVDDGIPSQIAIKKSGAFNELLALHHGRKK